MCNLQLHYYNSWKVDTVSNVAGVNANSGEAQDVKSSKRTFSNSFARNFSTSSVFNYFGGGSSSNNHTNNNNANNNNGNAQTPILNSASNIQNQQSSSKSNQNFKNNDYMIEDLMQLFSVVNIRIQKGRVFAGNSTLPSTLSLRFSNAKMELVTEKSQSKVDEYCFILKGDINKLEASFVPNKKHENLNLVAEKKVENRVLIFRSVSSDFEYVQDVPSILTFDRRYLQKNETGELIQNEKEPQWSLMLNCNKHTVLNYGPWFDLQREALWKFFFPQTFEKLEPQPEPTLNERRQTSKFDFLINFNDPNTEVNLIFTSNSNYHNSQTQTNSSNEHNKNAFANEKKLVSF